MKASNPTDMVVHIDNIYVEDIMLQWILCEPVVG